MDIASISHSWVCRGKECGQELHPSLHLDNHQSSTTMTFGGEMREIPITMSSPDVVGLLQSYPMVWLPPQNSGLASFIPLAAYPSHPTLRQHSPFSLQIRSDFKPHSWCLLAHSPQKEKCCGVLWLVLSGVMNKELMCLVPFRPSQLSFSTKVHFASLYTCPKSNKGPCPEF